MAVTQSPFTNPVQFGLTADATANATAENNIRGGPTTLYAMRITNTGGSAADAFVKLYDLTAPVVGTSLPTHIIPIKAATTRTVIFGIAGDDFASGLSIACVTTGGTGGTSNPSDTVTLSLWSDP